MAPALAFVSAALATVGAATLLAPFARDRSGAREAGGRVARLVKLLAVAGRRLRRRSGAAAPRDLGARIAAAGRPAGLGVRELMAAKLAGALAGAGAGILVGAAAPGRLGFLVIASSPAAGFLAPDMWLRRLAAERARSVRRELPGLLDLLRVTVEAGPSLAAALATVGARASGPLAREWSAVAREVSLGVPLSDSLAGLCVRLPLPEVRTLCSAIERATRHGAPLAEALAAQARDARAARRRRIEEEAAKAGPKIQLVVALLLVPSVLLLVAAALAAALLDSGGGVTGIA